MGEKKKLRERNQIESCYKWDIEDMYPEEEAWEQDYKEVQSMMEAFGGYSGRLGEGADMLLAALRARDALWQKLERLYVYARMRRDEDNRVAKYQSMCDRAGVLMSRAAAAASFFTPELLEVPEERLKDFFRGEKRLQIYGHLVDEILREKAHVLSAAEESLLAQMSEVTGATQEIFTMLNNADIRFGSIRDEEGEEVEVTHGRYISLLESRDRRVRREAFEHLYEAYEKQKNTLAATYSYNTKVDAVTARIRKYPSARAAALSADNVPISVYDSLVDTVNKALPLFHRYVKLRKKALGLKELHMYDMYVPLAELPREKVPYEKALELIREGLTPLGEEYLAAMETGLSSRWIDVYENQGKTSGAYSFGCYDSMPYILLNYDDTLKDVFTVAHEMGHSMHSYYTRKNQPFVYGDHSIFTAEVASTVNENLLMRHMLDKEKDPLRRKYLLNLYADAFRGTVFRQTMFAEFEQLTHQTVEEGGVLTAEWLSEEYGKLNRKYFGEEAFCDPQISMEWARIPHFYRAFYVYKYATGYSAAAALAEEILEEGAPAVEAYIKFLRSGSSNYPMDLLRGAGVDMSKPEPVERAMKTFEKLLVELETLV
ncbi:MAG: oligoendopeptidase F [Bacillota bacterium]|nr:oligoendopeptidase F [Bacillota bacterium]